ncbi:hypothetical protein ANRL1_03139 [Anaerolineae bacterium]|nr:hypothetical protein ANRL1_03139 [Anaerolineae bacterium]
MKVKIAGHIIVALALLLLAAPVVRAQGITMLGASQIGDNTAVAIDYDLEDYDRKITLFHDLENGILPPGSSSENIQRLRRSLLNHSSWAVHYVPKDRKHGDGELAVFVDSKTGAILGIYTEK